MPVYVCLPFLKLLHESESVSQLLSRVRLFATPWTAALQAPLSMGFSKQGYWSELPFTSPGCLPDPGIEPGSAALLADYLSSEPLGKPIPSRLCSCTGLMGSPSSSREEFVFRLILGVCFLNNSPAMCQSSQTQAFSKSFLKSGVGQACFM